MTTETMPDPLAAHLRTSDGVVGQVDPQTVPRWAGLTTFARLPRHTDVERFDAAVVGVPFDAGVTYRSGARFGPQGIRTASQLLKPYNPAQDVMPFEAFQVVDAGDIIGSPFDIAEAMRQIRGGASELLDAGAKLIVLGGDHTVAYPVLQALHAVHGPVGLLHFDAHLDTWGSYFGAQVTHGTPFRLATEQGLVDNNRLAHVGLRGGLYSRTDLADDADLGFTAIHCSDIDRIGTEGVVDRILGRLAGGPVYVSIDIDVLDPGIAPGTGTPEFGGLTGREMLRILRGLGGLNIVGADIVEVAPPYDHAEVTSLAAANLAYELLCLMASQQ
ncbi:agmatinase [Sinomonas gamaensis]|uniref:agmatinase n=1 Tax=Sinomonas gamaensis TaxID=2565624 RepID=UPI002016155A|nr:agmatinase [Sinomonas gamaensis]